jgi:hypothetical protein
MNYRELIAAVNKRVGPTPFNLWTIGMTDDSDKRRQQLIDERTDCSCWRDWEADSEKVATSILEHFQNKGMKSEVNGTKKSKYIYSY